MPNCPFFLYYEITSLTRCICETPCCHGFGMVGMRPKDAMDQLHLATRKFLPPMVQSCVPLFGNFIDWHCNKPSSPLVQRFN
ncbi:hypothetical protein Pyn_38462 [Prunus yedoensis var. nudiflora]|uniref:Uncharacterized protein n=1 Tax=Prunus yedoensis var. nudiflora TaxID=2094558 RepID=A0A314YME4_PRUYE|nr:hypothetical protein Pyn_38462 [Prunus yedoensis var. nudiflora]